MFLTKDDFLAHFPKKKISRAQFINKFNIMYSRPLTLQNAFSLKPIKMKHEGETILRKPIMKGKNDFRYKNREKIIDFFYQMLVTHRHYYLAKFYEAYFHPKNPFKMKWNSQIDLKLPNRKNISGSGKTLSIQKNDASKTILRNLFYKELLHETQITNTIKNHISFWQSLLNLYNKFQLEDRFFAPSSIQLFLRPKTSIKIPNDLPSKKPFPGFNPRLNYHNLFYLFQAYQPKASIMNPYFVHWILDNLFSGKSKNNRIFTPVLSWLAYLVAFFHTDGWSEYVGNDVMKSQCQKARFLADWYWNQGGIDNSEKNVTIYCQPSEELAKNLKFLKKYTNYFDLVLICPPYFDMEIYEHRSFDQKSKQSVDRYEDYQSWLTKYWLPTCRLCYQTCKKDGQFALIINNYFTLTGQYYPLVKDMSQIAKDIGFKEKNTYFLFNRTSPLRVNNKDRTERLIIFHK